MESLCSPVSPLCKSKQRLAYGVPSEGEVSVLCDVEADPDDLVYYWAFNSTVTGRVHNLSVTDNTRNVYTYKVNSVGKLLKQCLMMNSSSSSSLSMTDTPVSLITFCSPEKASHDLGLTFPI